MYIEAIDIIDYPADKIYPFMRDRIEELVPYLPNVESIKTLSKETPEKNRTKILNHWSIKTNEVPTLIKAFLKPEVFKWKDYALWKDEGYCVDYRLETFWFNDLYNCSGTNYFTPYNNGKQTEIKITANLEIHPEKIPGVPSFLAKKAMPLIETFIRKIMEPNLTSLAKGLKGYLKSNKI